MLRSLARAVVVAALSALPATVSAQAITYTFTGVGSGSYGATAFRNTAFTITVTGATVGGTYTPGAPAGVLRFDGLTGTIDLSGILTGGTFDSPVGVFVSHFNEAVGVGQSGALGADYYDLFASGVGLATYDLRSSFGPISGATDTGNQFVGIGVNGAPLTITNTGAGTFTAVTAATTSAPEPASLALIATGLLGIVLVGRRKRSA